MFTRPSQQHYWHHPIVLEEPSTTWAVQKCPVDNINHPVETTSTIRRRDDTKQPNSPADAGTPLPNNAAEDTHKHSISEKENPFSVQLKLPDGIITENLKVYVHTNVLFVEGKKRVIKNNIVNTTSYTRQFSVASDVDTDCMSAVINSNGVLVVTAPRKGEEEQPVPSSSCEPTTNTERTTNATTNTEGKPDEGSVISLETTTSTSSLPEVTATETQPQSQSVDETTTTTTTSPVTLVDEDGNKDVSVLVPFRLQVSQNDDAAFVVTIDLPPGVVANDIDLQLTNKRVLSISVEQRKDHNGALLTSKFVRDYTFDTNNADLEQISAKFDDTTLVLTVTVPTKKPVAVVEPNEQKIAIHQAAGADAAGASVSSTSAATKETHHEDETKEKSDEVSESSSSTALSNNTSTMDEHAETPESLSNDNDIKDSVKRRLSRKKDSWTNNEEKGDRRGQATKSNGDVQ